MNTLRYLFLAAGLITAPAFASPTASAEFIGVEGEKLGTASLVQTPSGVLIQARLQGLPEGEHGFHIHEAGKCEAPFKSAGGHFNPDNRKHGLMTEDGPHAGDMPNIHVPASGELRTDALNTFVTLEEGQPNSLLGGEGTALMIHAGQDDHESDPAGDAGARIACAVIE